MQVYKPGSVPPPRAGDLIIYLALLSLTGSIDLPILTQIDRASNPIPQKQKTEPIWSFNP